MPSELPELPAVAAAVALTTGAAAAAVPVPSAGPWEPFEGVGFNNCNGEDVQVTGQVREQVRVTQDAAGGEHVVIYVRVRTTGVGLTTGSKYLSNEGGTSTATSTFVGANTFTAPFVGTFLALDRDVPDLHYRFFVKVTIDANGNVRTLREKFEKNSLPLTVLGSALAVHRESLRLDCRMGGLAALTSEFARG